MSAPVTTRSKSEEAYDHIKRRILSRDYSPGYRLVLNTIASELGMSVVPVREAIRQLEAEHLVTFERNVGAHVAMIDDSDYRFSMQTLGLLEGAATALAASHLDAATIATAREINARMKASLEHFDPQRFTQLNQEFHSTLYTACSNPRLLVLVHAEWARMGNLRHSTFTFVPGRARESVAEHEALLKLIEANAPLDEIEKAARRHRLGTLRAYVKHEHPDEALGLADL